MYQWLCNLICYRHITFWFCLREHFMILLEEHVIWTYIVYFFFTYSVSFLQRSILLDCEEQIKKLLATTFENYKSLDELSPTGLTNLFGPIPESAAPALSPAVQIFNLLYDILSLEHQKILRNYLQVGPQKFVIFWIFLCWSNACKY